ncbi:RidA family protein [Chondrinema litorale]|uniref:RidA family protein n=1 Tax=Chondrinema litorale TaxID=2994555 RepID=UPI0025436A7F|nr:RidA family protein [Chondrinema litorale]UZR94421.1 RidA family protein [Chondrinema litorale]
MSKRILISSGNHLEDEVGYSRAVRVGNIIEISGTTAVVDGEVVGVGDAYEQTKCICQKIEKVLKDAGASLADVTRIRIYLTDIGYWKDATRAYSEFFKEIKPACSILEVNGFIGDELLVELETSAVVAE